jgi:hydrogenase nickel incorporation protein HypA/HybF
MHELSIATSLLEAVHAESLRHAGARVRRVGLRIGELSGVDPESLRFCFECLVKDSPFEPLPLEIQFCPRRQTCPACRRTFSVVDYNTVCPSCGRDATECTGGTELELSYLELEES